jgi:hypothetical protein
MLDATFARASVDDFSTVIVDGNFFPALTTWTELHYLTCETFNASVLEKVAKRTYQRPNHKMSVGG